jgi:hypothetical protein
MNKQSREKEFSSELSETRNLLRETAEYLSDIAGRVSAGPGHALTFLINQSVICTTF